MKMPKTRAVTIFALFIASCLLSFGYTVAQKKAARMTRTILKWNGRFYE
jgi:hypothetical protein